MSHSAANDKSAIGYALPVGSMLLEPSQARGEEEMWVYCRFLKAGYDFFFFQCVTLSLGPVSEQSP